MIKIIILVLVLLFPGTGSAEDDFKLRLDKCLEQKIVLEKLCGNPRISHKALKDLVVKDKGLYKYLESFDSGGCFTFADNMDLMCKSALFREIFLYYFRDAIKFEGKVD